MANLNITNIPAPRVPFIDERTGLMAREWYRFFLNLFVLTGSGNNPVSLEELQLGPPNQPDLTELLIQINQNIAPQYEDQSGDFLATLDTAQLMSMMSRFENAEAAIQGAYLQPVVQTGTIANYNLDGSPTAGGIAYGTGPALAVSAAGTLGQVLTSGGAGTPTWATDAGGSVTSVSVVSANGLAGTVATATTTPAITLSTTVTGLLKGNGTAISAAASGTDYAPATSGTSILYGNGAGGFSNVTIGTGVAFSAGTLSATGSGGTVTNVTGTAPVVSSGGTTPAISMPAATTSVDGYLTSTDWTTFNNKGSGTVTSVAALTLGTTGTDLSSTVATGTTTPVITLQVPTASASNRGALSAADWTTFNNKGSGSVTSVSFTGGIVTVATPTTTPALTVAGTSGGIPYFSSASTWATSALLTNNAIMLGGGAAATPKTTTTGTGVVTALGVNTGTAGAFVVNGGALGTPSSGSVTNLTGTASININGTVGATTATTGVFTTIRTGGVALESTGASQIGSGGFVMYAGAITNAPAALSVVLDQQAAGVARLMSSGAGTWTSTLAINPYGGVVYVGTTTDLGGGQKFQVSGTTALGGNTAVSGNLGVTSYATTDAYFWSKGVGSAGGLFLGAAGSQNGQISQGSTGSGTISTYIGNALITAVSDLRLKENVVDTKRNALKILEQLRVVDHTWNDPSDQCENNRNSRGVWMGLIAQEAQPIIPWLVNKPTEDINENGDPQYWHMDYGYSVPLLVKAIQELNVITQAQSQTIDSLTARIVTLENK